MSKNKNSIIEDSEETITEIELTEKQLFDLAKILEVEPINFMATIELPIITTNMRPPYNRKIFYSKKKLTS
jgi:hypothetical protein